MNVVLQQLQTSQGFSTLPRLPLAHDLFFYIVKKNKTPLGIGVCPPPPALYTSGMIAYNYMSGGTSGICKPFSYETEDYGQLLLG